jgi:hypothetical protein
MKKELSLAIILSAWLQMPQAQVITTGRENNSFEIFSPKGHSQVIVDENDFPLVQKAAAFFVQDIDSLSGKSPGLLHSLPSSAKNIIIIGSLDRSSFIRQLLAAKKLNTDKIKGKWEAYQVSIISQPAKGIDRALVIAGSDRRGTAYGVFELSRQMGVSPWYWWADVPVKKKNASYITNQTVLIDSPAVKYRGIFINDEAPAFSGWAKEKFGGINHHVYEKVFELLLRLKANYLWPAMWGNAFNDDDSLNPQLADEYGIVMGNSHHEPMMRAQQEWKRYGSGPWNYDSNAVTLRAFWKKGIENIDSRESIVTIGMRGDGDMPMTEGSNIALLERIVQDQRKIIETVTGKPAAETPQLWALYKEVQDYYDKGMRVPDDVTLLLCDDNWGNIRRLPNPQEKPRSGGYGIYYHFDYVGGPRNYKWLNTNNIARVWEQMHLAWEYHARKIWIVNVGDIKPMEFPISFFADYAWKPTKWNEDNLQSYYTCWAAEQFWDRFARQTGNIIRKYSQYNARRKPELISPETYSLDNYNEADNVVKDYHSLLSAAEKLNTQLPAAYRDSFFELVLHPVKACANLNELYVTVAKNHWYAATGNPLANQLAEKAKQLYRNDSLISLRYNSETAGGKWNHMMDQTHIGYTYWQQPLHNKMPELKYVSAGIVSATPSADNTGNMQHTANQFSIPMHSRVPCFYEKDGYISIEAEHYSRAINTTNIRWTIIPDIGRTASGICAFPVTCPVQQPHAGSSHTEYDFYSNDTGRISVSAYFNPTLNFQHNDDGLQYAASIDDEAPVIISINKEDNNVREWEKWVADNIIIKKTMHLITRPGRHVLKYWLVNPGVVLQKLVIDFWGVRSSYLGPPETKSK